MKHLPRALGVILIMFSVSAAQTQNPTGTTGTEHRSARANLIDGEGRPVGQAHLQQTSAGILVRLELKQVTPGIHGVHLHDVGRCDRPSFESAGDHFNPTNRQHGFLNPRGPHLGDLPNIEVPPSTELSVEYFLTGVTLDGDATSLMDANGAALVIHAAKDDYLSDPAGESGDRLACGRIVPSGEPLR